MTRTAQAAANPNPGRRAYSTVDQDETGASFFAEPLAAWASSITPGQEQTSRLFRQYVFIATGSGIGRFRDGALELATGAILMVPPGARWSLDLAPGSTGMWMAGRDEFIGATVRPALAFLPPQSWERSDGPTVFHGLTATTASARRAQAMSDLTDARERLPFAEAVVATYMLVVVTCALIDSRLGDPIRGAVMEPIGDADARLMLDFRRLIEQHLAKKLSIAEYARELGVGVERLNRACRAVGGTTPLGVLTMRLTQKAKQELSHSAASVATIGYQLGFADPAYFSRFFKRYTGLSPSEYRGSISNPDDFAAAPVLGLRVIKMDSLPEDPAPH